MGAQPMVTELGADADLSDLQALAALLAGHVGEALAEADAGDVDLDFDPLEGPAPSRRSTPAGEPRRAAPLDPVALVLQGVGYPDRRQLLAEHLVLALEDAPRKAVRLVLRLRRVVAAAVPVSATIPIALRSNVLTLAVGLTKRVTVRCTEGRRTIASSPA